MSPIVFSNKNIKKHGFEKKQWLPFKFLGMILT
jgi:hypothetical protein